MKNKRNVFIFIGVAVLIVIIAIIIGQKALPRSPSLGNNTTGQMGEGQGTQENTIPTRISDEAAIPKTAPAESAKPTQVAQVRDGNQMQTFDVRIEGNVYSPKSVFVHKGDTVKINFSAIDRDYDFYQPDYGYYKMVKKGTTELVMFDATAEGIFTFYCKSCGGPQTGPIGEIIVAKK